MAAISYDWDTSWTDDTVLNGSTSISNGSTQAGDVISLDEKAAVQISVAWPYGGTASAEGEIYLLRDVNGTDYEAYADNPYGYTMGAKTTSTTHRRVEAFSAAEFARFKVLLRNPTGAACSPTVKYRFATIKSA